MRMRKARSATKCICVPWRSAGQLKCRPQRSKLACRGHDRRVHGRLLHTSVARRGVRCDTAGEMRAACPPGDGSSHVCRHPVAVLDYIRFRGTARRRSGNDVWIGGSQLYRTVRCVLRSRHSTTRIPACSWPYQPLHKLLIYTAGSCKCAAAFCVENLCDISLYGTYPRPLVHSVSR